jgi:orotidine-5'-phosphate decarboxylase
MEGLPRMRESLIVALDTDAHTALGLARSLAGTVSWLKIGMTLYYSEGPRIVGLLRDMGYRVFVDLKLHDIPHQVQGAARELGRHGASMLTVHGSGGVEMMVAALQGACEGSAECGADTPDVIAVTVLTSLSAEALASTGVEGTPRSQALLLAGLAREAGLQGVVCSPAEARDMRDLLGSEALVVTPGVRPPGIQADDQARVATPLEAISSGASHIVVGRPITGAPDPVEATLAILEMLGRSD